MVDLIHEEETYSIYVLKDSVVEEGLINVEKLLSENMMDIFNKSSGYVQNQPIMYIHTYNKSIIFILSSVLDLNDYKSNILKHIEKTLGGFTVNAADVFKNRSDMEEKIIVDVVSKMFIVVDSLHKLAELQGPITFISPVYKYINKYYVSIKKFDYFTEFGITEANRGIDFIVEHGEIVIKDNVRCILDEYFK